MGSLLKVSINLLASENTIIKSFNNYRFHCTSKAHRTLLFYIIKILFASNYNLTLIPLSITGHLITLAILFLCNRICAEPGYLDFDNLPETNFTCAGKVIGGYYADLETSCQMFHVCTIGQLDEPMDIKFLCLNGTVFDQETRVCERVDEVIVQSNYIQLSGIIKLPLSPGRLLQV